MLASYRLFTPCCLVAASLLATGCEQMRSAHTWSRDYGQRQMPTDAPRDTTSGKYDERTDGGTLYKQHCSRCHNARPLGERSLAMNEVSLAHMRNFGGLTGEEYRKIVLFMRRWHGVGPASPDVETTPKKLFFDDPDKKGSVGSEPLQGDDEDKLSND